MKYKKSRKNQQADALSRLFTNSETVWEDDYNEVFTLDLISLNNRGESLEDLDPEQELAFIDVQYTDLDNEIARKTTPKETPFEPIEL